MVNKFVLNDQFEEIISLFEKSSKNIFIKEGEMIRIDTENNEYSSRVKA